MVILQVFTAPDQPVNRCQAFKSKPGRSDSRKRQSQLPHHKHQYVTRTIYFGHLELTNLHLAFHIQFKLVYNSYC